MVKENVQQPVNAAARLKISRLDLSKIRRNAVHFTALSSASVQRVRSLVSRMHMRISELALFPGKCPGVQNRDDLSSLFRERYRNRMLLHIGHHFFYQ